MVARGTEEEAQQQRESEREVATRGKLGESTLSRERERERAREVEVIRRRRSGV